MLIKDLDLNQQEIEIKKTSINLKSHQILLEVKEVKVVNIDFTLKVKI